MKLGLAANHRRKKSPGSAQFVTPTATTYLSHYGFYNKPFNIIPEPKFLWIGERYRKVLENFRNEIVHHNGHIVITGDIGTGKSTLAALLVNELKDQAVPAKVSCTNVGLFDMCKLISTAFRIGGDFADQPSFLPAFESFLRDSFSDGKKSVLIFDEAQRLTLEQVLDLMRLAELGENDTKWLTLVFVGQNEFKDRLEEESHRVLREKVALQYEVPSLSLEETKEYVFTRLRAAQGENGASLSPERTGRYVPRRTKSPPQPKEIFPPEALKEVFFLSKGIPRLINNICDFALLSTYFEGGKVILPKTVKNCVQKLHLPADFTAWEAKGAEASSRTERKAAGPGEENGGEEKVQRLWAGTDKKAWIMPFSTAAILVIVFFGILFFFSEEGSLLQKFFLLDSKEISRTILPILPPKTPKIGGAPKSAISSAVEAAPPPNKAEKGTGPDASQGSAISEKTVTPEKTQVVTPSPEKIIPPETLKEGVGPSLQSAAPEKMEAKSKPKIESLNTPSEKAPPSQKSNAAASKAESPSPLGSGTLDRPRREAKGAAGFHEPSSPFAESKGEKPAAILSPIPQVKPSESHPKATKEIEPDKVIDYLLEKRSRNKK